MGKTKIIISLSLAAAITFAGVCVFANKAEFKEKGNRPSFKMSQHEFKKPEMTEEQKAEMQGKMKEQLAKKLEDGKITQDEYDEMLAKIEAGEFENRGFMGKGPKGQKREMPELTEEQKAELKEKMESGEFKGHGFMGKGQKREMPELTEEQKAELKEKMESGEFKGRGFMGKGPVGGRHGMMKRFFEKPAEVTE